MPQDLVGFYFDAEKNRYFPHRGPIVGSTLPPKKPRLELNRESTLKRRLRIGSSKLILDRELYGKLITFGKRKCNFQEEYRKLQVSQPVVWKYNGTQRMSDGALELAHINLLTPAGQTGVNILLAGGVNGCLSFLEVDKAVQLFGHGTRYMSHRAWPLSIKKQENGCKASGHVLSRTENLLQLSSNISCIKVSTKQSRDANDGGLSSQHALITTLGSESSGGCAYILDFTKPLDHSGAGHALRRRMDGVASFNCTIWTADYRTSQGRAVIGTNMGAALVDLETGLSSWVCRSKSDVLSLQFDQSENIVLCGFRNGAIVTVDVRQKQDESSDRLPRHRITHTVQKIQKPLKQPSGSSKPWFELKGNIHPSQTVCMPSSISCLLSLQLHDQYFLASSMDGLIKLYDQRQTKRGAVQSYEGNVNSHTRLQLGIDPSERFMTSGGEDNGIRLWGIKSGEMLFEEKISDSIISTVCWPRTSDRSMNGSGAWFGSHEGLFHMQWP